MLHAESHLADDISFDAWIDAPHVIQALPTGVIQPAPLSVSRYGKGTRPNIALITAILILHVVLIGALVQIRTHAHRAEDARLTVVNLSPPPSPVTPPPPAADAPPPPSAPVIVAPPPIVQTPVPVIMTVPTTPHPVPVAAPGVSSASTVPSPVAALPAPPATIQGGDLGARMVSGKPPRYPIESRRKHEQGIVTLTLTLGLDGAVETIAVTQSSGFDRLDDAARNAVRTWRWQPIVRNGQPVRVKGVVEIPFVLRVGAA